LGDRAAVAPDSAGGSFSVGGNADAALTVEAAAIQIVAFGDSATTGYLVAARDADPAQFQAVLRSKGDDVAVPIAGTGRFRSVSAAKTHR
jgi:lysophospholipase L1-like esterase